MKYGILILMAICVTGTSFGKTEGCTDEQVLQLNARSSLVEFTSSIEKLEDYFFKYQREIEFGLIAAVGQPFVDLGKAVLNQVSRPSRHLADLLQNRAKSDDPAPLAKDIVFFVGCTKDIKDPYTGAIVARVPSIGQFYSVSAEELASDKKIEPKPIKENEPFKISEIGQDNPSSFLPVKIGDHIRVIPTKAIKKCEFCEACARADASRPRTDRRRTTGPPLARQTVDTHEDK